MDALSLKIVTAGAKQHRLAVKLMEAELERRVPRKTGALARSKKVRYTSSMTRPSATISYDARTPMRYGGQDYATITDRGPHAHVIRPRYRKVLRFVKGGKVIYARKVNWRPDGGVYANKGWFSSTCTASRWRALLGAAGRLT